MCSSVRILVSASVLYFGLIQTLAAPTSPQDDPAYQLFAYNVQLLTQQAGYKLNLSREVFLNNTRTFNIPEFDVINSTLTGCFEGVKKDYPEVDEFCLEFIGQDVQQTISDSKSELDSCTNLTRGWELIDQLLIKAEKSLEILNGLVDKVLPQALSCVKRYASNPNPALKTNCLNTITGVFNIQMANATSLVQEAYYLISGGNLLLGAEVSSCQKAENISFTEKCNTIVSDVLANCVTNISSSSSTAAP